MSAQAVRGDEGPLGVAMLDEERRDEDVTGRPWTSTSEPFGLRMLCEAVGRSQRSAPGEARGAKQQAA